MTDRTPGERGLFLAFEGVEGSGKTTQVNRLAARLRASGVDVAVAREPGGTELGERVRAAVLDASLEVPPRSELFLMLAARAAFVEQVVDPGLRRGSVVIADRFELSTLAYQGAGRGLDPDEVAACNRFATGGRVPDATVLLDVDPGIGAERQRRAGKAADRMELEEAAFHRRVAEGYRALAGRVAGIVLVDATGDPDRVEERVLSALAARFPRTFDDAGVITP
jgi:dTMP kinase